MKRQNIYYIKLQEKLATLDCGKNYVLKITSIKDNITSDEEVVIQKKDAEKSQGINFYFWTFLLTASLSSFAVKNLMCSSDQTRILDLKSTIFFYKVEKI